MRNLLLLVVPVALAACSVIQDWSGDYSTMKSTETRGSYEVRKASAAPELEPKRPVSDQDCAKAFDPSQGNLRCR